MSTFLNQTIWSDSEPEMGSRALEEIQKLVWHLSRPAGEDTWKNPFPSGTPDNLRYAPSVIIRSELEVYGVSSPRFALRYTYTAEGSGFINLRRLQRLEEVLSESHPGGFSLPAGVSGWNKLDVRELNISSELSVADSFLIPPERYNYLDYHHVTAPLAAEFGETDPGQAPPRQGSPYVRTPRFGVGLCAQACCFVTTLLNSQRGATQVCGLAEISALVDSTSNILEVDGLTQEQMVKYFEAVNLRAIWQALPEPKDEDLRAGPFEEALHAYVASKVPVIACLDQKRLPRKSLPEDDVHPTDPAHHAVTIIGCNRWLHMNPEILPGRHSKVRESSFLYHDSAGMPFTEVTCTVLRLSGMPFMDPSGGVPARGPRDYPNLLPVTARQVTIPLLDWRIDRQSPPSLGLLRISRALRHDGTELGEDREFRLLQIKDAYHLLEFFSASERAAVAPFVFPAALIEETAREFGWAKDGTHWVWCEVGKPGKGFGSQATGAKIVKVWDAEADPDLLLRPNEVLRGVLRQNPLAGQWGWKWNPWGAAAARTAGQELTVGHPPHSLCDEERNARNLKPSVISSFERRAANIKQSLPEKGGFLEYYACMNPDLRSYFPGYTALRTALRVFAASLNESAADHNFANHLQKDFGDESIVGFATYLPEITAEPSGGLWRQAVDALRFLVRSAHHLKRPGHPFVIELVAGSILQGLGSRPGVGNTKRIVVGRRPTEASINELLERLIPVAEEALKLGSIYLALELEPGPLFLLNDRNALRFLCEALNNSGSAALKQVVGLNLDIPHWAWLARPAPTVCWIEQNYGVLNRIVHAHISDHGIGHLSDLHLELIHQRREMDPWLRLLERRAASKPDPANGILPFSGFVSVEHEACKTQEQLHRSFQSLTDWI